MTDNIDFGDPINFSPLQKTPPSSPGMDVSRGAAKDSFAQVQKPTVSKKPAPISHIPREPAHAVKNIAPLFPRSSGVAPQASQVSKAPESPVSPFQPGMGSNTNPAPLSPEAAMHPEASIPKKKKPVLFAGIIIVAVLVLGGVGYFVFTGLSKKPTNTSNTTTQANQASNTANTTNTATNTTNTPTVNDPTGDPDGDALTNQEEARYGTDPNNPDSDGDTFKDGAEVEKGFNPLGAGKLSNPQP